MSDEEFLTEILAQICDYAIKNGYEPDETIKTVAENMLVLLAVSTFNEWEGTE